MMSGGDSNNKAMVTVIVSIALLAILVIIIIYAVYRYKQSNLESTVLVEEPLKLYGMKEAKKIKGTDLTSASVGQEFTYSLWLYLVDYEDSSSDYRMIFMRSEAEDDLNGSNPIVFMDGRTNRLYVSARSNSSRHVSDLSELVPDGAGGTNSNHFLTGVVEYVPLQRWVNLVIVFQDNLMTLYLDGEMYSVRNVHDLWKPERSANRPILSGSQGDIFVGPTTQNSNSIRGFLSGLKYFNHALMADAIHGIYQHGPNYKTWMSKLGITRRYGFQSPIYRLDKEDEDEEDDD